MRLRLLRHAHLVLRQPLPEPIHAAERAVALGIRKASWESLDEDSRLAWSVWEPIRGQVSMLNQQVAKSDDVTLILDTAAALASMDWMGVPPDARRAVWSGVMSLHDIGSHGLRDFPRICQLHHLGDRIEHDDGCWKCSGFWADDT